MAIFFLFLVLYAYQIFYMVAVFFKKPKMFEAKKQHRFAVISTARNESAVIGNFIDSVKKQNYPADLLDIFIIADNCTDDTAEIARAHGAYVFERNNTEKVGKGYALDYCFTMIKEQFAHKNYEGYFVFDADNLLDKNYVAEMNKVFDNGYRAITSYRNSKNYSQNWITAGYALWFLREAKYLNNARMMLKTSCAISGTGFLLSSDLIEENDGWKYNLLTEDIQFSVANILKGEKIGYCGTAKFYDEQPYTFEQSWKQRMRWCKGFYQVVGKYGASLFAKMFTRFACFDMFMTIMPAIFVTLLSLGVNLAFMFVGLLHHESLSQLVWLTLKAIALSGVWYYSVLYIFGIITTISEWQEIRCRWWHKLKFSFTFPIFIFTYIPISIVALFKKVHWEPIRHDVNVSIESLNVKNLPEKTEKS